MDSCAALVVSKRNHRGPKTECDMRRMGKSYGRVSPLHSCGHSHKHGWGRNSRTFRKPILRRFHATFNFAKFRLMLLFPSASLRFKRYPTRELRNTGTLVKRRPIQPKATLVEVSCYVLPRCSTSTFSQDKEVSCYV